MGRPAAAHAAWPQRRGGGLSLVTGRPRDLARVRKASSALPRRVQYSFLRMSIYSFLLQHDRCCRRRHQRHGRIQERSGPEMYTVSCATSSLLPLLRAPSFHLVGFGRCSPSTTSTTQRTSPFPNPRRPLVSVSSRSRRIRKFLPQLCVCVLSPGNDGVHMVHPFAWPTQLLGSPASPQRAGRWSPWTPEKADEHSSTR